MIEWLVRQLFRWDSLRSELLAEASFYNGIRRVLKDPKSMAIASTFWDEGDGWRGWTLNNDLNKYYFNDVPENLLEDCMSTLDDMEGTIRL